MIKESGSITGNKKCFRMIIIMLVAVLLMGITNYTKTFLGNDETTNNVRYISVDLVVDAMLVSYYDEEATDYGLMEVYRYNGSSIETLNNDEYTNGYHNSMNRIAVADNEFTSVQYQVGNILEFYSGNSARITGVEADGTYLYVDYSFVGAQTDESEDMADEEAYAGSQGSLLYLYVRDGNTGEVLAPGSVLPYVSQLGLQGKIFSMFPKTMTIKAAAEMYQWILAFAFAVVITLICLGLYRKYDADFAVVFYLVTLLSPWVIGFSTNTYWMEVTWFLPLLVGIFCSNHIESQKARIASYLLAFVTVAFKCACGYEYITVVMLGTIVFLLADLTMAIMKKQKENIKLLLRTIFLVGVFALLGFVVVILIHANLRGDGDILAGIQAIYREDVLRRTLGGSSNMFQDVYAESLEAPIIYVLARYFLFKTPLLLGIPGIVFIFLVAISFAMILYGVVRKKMPKEIMVIYIWLGVMCVSWFVLGKAHSYVHTFLNYVMWYMGFVQIIFYVPIHWIACKIRQRRSKV